MIRELNHLVERMMHPNYCETGLIHWGSPIISFGDLHKSVVATVGLNPSNREFVDEDGNELTGENRRFQTLGSLGIKTWSDLNDSHIESIIEASLFYFKKNPYDNWFRKLDYIISETGYSYYFPSEQACHLDLIPFATHKKWSDLDRKVKDLLLFSAQDTLGNIINKTNIRVLILNGQTVVDNIERLCGIKFKSVKKADWTLPRKDGNGVCGYAYYGIIAEIGKVKLYRPILVLGYNHNIQSSFGVTTKVQSSIRKWIGTFLRKSEKFGRVYSQT